MKNPKLYGTLLLSVLALASCKKNTEETKAETSETVVEATAEVIQWTIPLEARSGSNVTGSTTFTEENGEVKLHVMVSGLTPGEHGIHIHEAADCSAPDGSSAGGHWNPTNVAHGKWGEGEHHRGDIGNLVANENGEAHLELTTDLWCLTCEDPTKNLEGKSIIVHEKADDFKTQPTGDAGGRQACGGIIKK